MRRAMADFANRKGRAVIRVHFDEALTHVARTIRQHGFDMDRERAMSACLTIRGRETRVLSVKTIGKRRDDETRNLVGRRPCQGREQRRRRDAGIEPFRAGMNRDERQQSAKHWSIKARDLVKLQRRLERGSLGGERLSLRRWRGWKIVFRRAAEGRDRPGQIGRNLRRNAGEADEHILQQRFGRGIEIDLAALVFDDDGDRGVVDGAEMRRAIIRRWFPRTASREPLIRQREYGKVRRRSSDGLGAGGAGEIERRLQPQPPGAEEGCDQKRNGAEPPDHNQKREAAAPRHIVTAPRRRPRLKAARQLPALAVRDSAAAPPSLPSGPSDPMS